VPSEADNSSFCQNVKLRSGYPLVKIGDILWTYMGEPAEAATAA
jgi:phthalate 4,5-dioxygenase